MQSTNCVNSALAVNGSIKSEVKVN